MCVILPLCLPSSHTRSPQQRSPELEEAGRRLQPGDAGQGLGAQCSCPQAHEHTEQASDTVSPSGTRRPSLAVQSPTHIKVLVSMNKLSFIRLVRRFYYFSLFPAAWR